MNDDAAAVSDRSARPAERSIQGLHGVRYQTTDVQRAVHFYTTHLGFTLEQQHLPAFATLSIGGVHLLLSGPGASGSRPMPDGRPQEAGGWNRIVLRVTDLTREIRRLEQAGVKFRNALESGPGGRQIQIEDPDGNPIELFEPASRR
ncbi:MAG TPA: VOC family protein [Vicinamibacterales bacterium]|nr:VOC family protein [Vicinamibacterales bacterium]